MEFDANGNPIVTPNNTSTDDQTGANQIPGDDGENGSDWEKRYKDTQAFATKAQQDKINMAKMLVEQNPANIERIEDEKVRKKILQDRWDVDTVEELKTLFPDFAKTETNAEEDELTEVEKLQREVKLMRYQSTKTKINEEIDAFVEKHKEAAASVTNFRDKVNDELKNISEKLSPKERVERATRLVINGNVSTADAYSIMQGASGFVSGNSGEQETKPIGKDLIKEIMSKQRT